QLKNLYDSKIWVRPKKFKNKSIESLRQATLKSAFLSLVPNSIEDQSKVGYEPDVANTKGMQIQNQCLVSQSSIFSDAVPCMAPPIQPESYSFGGSNQSYMAKRAVCPPPPRINPLNIKSQMLHLVCGEIKLNQILRPESTFTVVCSDLEWFGPSL